MSGRRFRASSWGAAAIILALILLVFHRFGSFLLFFVIGAGLLWYGRSRREAAEEETGAPGAAPHGEQRREGEGDAGDTASAAPAEPPPAGSERDDGRD